MPPVSLVDRWDEVLSSNCRARRDRGALRSVPSKTRHLHRRHARDDLQWSPLRRAAGRRVAYARRKDLARACAPWGATDMSDENKPKGVAPLDYEVPAQPRGWKRWFFSFITKLNRPMSL